MIELLNVCWECPEWWNILVLLFTLLGRLAVRCTKSWILFTPIYLLCALNLHGALAAPCCTMTVRFLRLGKQALRRVDTVRSSLYQHVCFWYDKKTVMECIPWYISRVVMWPSQCNIGEERKCMYETFLTQHEKPHLRGNKVSLNMDTRIATDCTAFSLWHFLTYQVWLLVFVL